MKLRTRLTIAFLVVVLMPILLFGLTFAGISQYQTHVMKENYGIEGDVYGIMSDSVKVYSKVTEKIFDEIGKTACQNPQKFEDQQFLMDINRKLVSSSSFLIIKKSNEISFTGNAKKTEEIHDLLPDMEEGDNFENSETYIRDKQILMKQIYFEFPDESEGNAFIITETSDMIPQVKSTLVQMLISVVLILILTGLGLVSWIYKELVSPLKQLAEATQKISEGNLDFTMDLSEHADEIDNLCKSFEEMRKRLKESTEEKLQNDMENRALISNITHDLKTPVTAIKGYAEGIIDGVADTKEKQEKYVKTIYNKATDLDRLINELTFYSGIDANRIPYNFAKINVADYFSDCVEEMAMDLDSKNIRLNFHNYLKENTIVIADPIQMKKVINNIIGNSAKYIDKAEGIINIRLKDAEEFVVIEIEDNGKGIAAKDLTYIFDRFYRTDASRNSSKGGSGIGLSIVKKIVEDHGGRIWATSKLNIGTTMLMELRKYKEVSIDE